MLWIGCSLTLFLFFIHFLAVGLIYGGHTNRRVPIRGANNYNEGNFKINDSDIVESEKGVVAADDARCSEVGASILRQGGHAVDAAVATTLCLGVVNSMASGIGGGGFMLVRSSATSQTQAFDLRETAPIAASQVSKSSLLAEMLVLIETHVSVAPIYQKCWRRRQINLLGWTH